MLHALMEWGSSFSAVRRPTIKLWRKLERLQRASVSKAVFVVTGEEGRLLVLSSPSEALRLPAMELHPGDPIATQVAAFLSLLLHQEVTPSLVAIDGTPRQGVSFLYQAVAASEPKASAGLWLDAQVAFSCLTGEHRRLLRLYVKSSTG